MAGQRDISSEQILYILINLREHEAEMDSFTEIQVKKEECREIGLFQYKIKETDQSKTSRLFLISELHDGKPVQIIYDENGRAIAWKEQKEQLQVAKDVELNEEKLNNQVRLAEQREENKNSEGSNSNTAKAGDGRDLATKEHEDIHEEKKEPEKEEKEEKKEEKTLKNLKDDISLSGKPKIRLNEIINGYYLWQILDIENKLKTKMPEGVNEKAFRYGYLTVIDSSQLEAKDGKQRPLEKTLAITTADGSSIIELDEEVLAPTPKRHRKLQEQIEKETINYRDGKEADKPKNDLQTTELALFEIPNARERFNISEKWYLSIDVNQDYKLNGRAPMNGNIDEISFVQQSTEQPIEDIRIGKNQIKTKLEAINEGNPTLEERKQIDDLKKFDSSEAKNTIINHTEELVQECYAKYEKLRRIL